MVFVRNIQLLSSSIRLGLFANNTLHNDILFILGVTMAGVLTQLDTPTLAADYAWDWGMGWGWSGYSASYCSTCAMEQAALINSNIGHSSNVESITAPSSDIPSNTNIQDYLNSYDGDDNEIGELGEATDVGCDFGDFGF